MLNQLNLNRPPKIVGKLRYLCRKDKCGSNEDTVFRLKKAAHELLFTITALGLENNPARWPTLWAYYDAADLIFELTEEKWPGEGD
jgi:hypothetical protein